MAQHRRRASIQAEAVNKQIAEQALADADEIERASSMGAQTPQRASAMSPERASGVFSNGSSPLSSLRDETPTPGSGWGSSGGGMGLGMQIRRETAGKPTLIQQVQKANAAGVNAEGAIKGILKKTGGGQMAGTPMTKTGGPGGNGQMGVTSTKMRANGNQPLSTPPNKSKDGPKGGNTQKKLRFKDGLLPSSSPLGAGGSVQKRPIATYLENAPDNEEQEREHKRPAQREWGTAAAPGPIRQPLNNLRGISPFQQGPRKIYNDPGIMMLAGPGYGSDPNHCDLSHLFDDEIRYRNEPMFPHVFGFDDLPQYSDFEVGPGKPVSDSFIVHQQHLKYLDERSKTGVRLHEDQIEEYRLQSMLVKLMGDQKKDSEEMKTRTRPAEKFHGRGIIDVDISMLALMKLKPARKKIDPPLFAQGTWHKSRRMEDEDVFGCSFCLFDCDYGVSDARVLLPVEASGVFCSQCHYETITSIDGWKITFDANKDRREVLRENQDRFTELSDKAATPPLKELADDNGFKKQAIQQRALTDNRSLKERRQAPVSDLQVGNAQQYNEQVMSAFKGAEGHISPMLPQNSQISLSTLFNTFSVPDREKLSVWLKGMTPQQKQQFTARIESLDTQKQWQLLAESCSRLGANQPPVMGASVVTQKQTQAMATVVGTLGPAQQQFMLQSLSKAARGHISPVMGGATPVTFPITNSWVTGSNSQRRPSIGNGPPDLQPSTQTVSSDNGSTNAQQMATASSGQRSPYSPLPPPSPKTLVNFGGSLDGQQNLNPGPDGDPLIQSSMLNGGKPGNNCQNHHRRISSGTISLPSPTIMLSGNVTPTFPNGWPTNGFGSSPPTHPSMFNGEMPGSNNQQRRLSNGSMPPPSPTMMVSGLGTSNGQHGRLSNGPGSSPPMPPLKQNRATLGNNLQRRPSDGSLPPQSPSMMVNGSGTQNAQRDRATSGPGSSPPIQPSMPNGTQMPTQGCFSSGPNARPQNMLNGTDSLPKGTVANTSNQRRLSNSGNRPLPPQTPANKQLVQVITLTKSGGIIGPTTISKSTANSNNSSSNPRPNGSGSPAPANLATTQRRNSNGQQQIGSLTGHSRSSPVRNNAIAPNNTNTRPHLPGSSPPTPANDPINGLRISTGQQIAGGNANLPSPNFVSGLTNGAHKLPPQPNARRLSSPSGVFPGMSPPDTQSNTLTPNIASSPLVAPFIPPSYFTSPSPVTGPSPQSASTISNAGSSAIMPDAQSHSHPRPPALQRAHTSPIPNSRSMGPPPRPGVQRSASQSDSRKITQVQQLLFCRGCPWRQIDIKKARICEGCKAEKLAIIKHRHTKFFSLNERSGVDLGRGKGIGHGQLANTHKRTCMVCPGLAAAKCQDCPLRVCTDCQVQLTMMCKLPSLSHTI